MGVAQVPSGTVTFLFTDIEASTRLWQEYPQEMSVALERHEEIVRAAIERRDGYVFSTAGDAFAAAFGHVGDAVSAAQSAQEALADESWLVPEPIRVRMGLHVGEAQERGGDYFGTVVNTAARIMSAGHGGQVLCSWEVAELARHGDRAREVVFRDLGAVRLRDLLEPIHMVQVASAGDGSTFPPLRSVDAVPNNLPIVASRLVGRSAEIERIRAMMSANRCVTLTGVGGCGKTRLALAVAAEVADSFPDGVVFVDLAPVSSDDRVAEAVVDAGGFRVASPAGDLRLDAIARFVARRRMLVILDNCEHVLDAAAELVERTLTAGPEAAMLMTSREALEVDGEHTFRVPSLSKEDDPEDDSAVELLIDRAYAADHRFTLPVEDRAAARALCRHLDGLPLAIELAAAQLVHLDVADLADRLDRRFELLVGGRRRRRQRQQTLQAMMDWSWDLLDTDEQHLLSSLSVFTGSVGLDAIQAVCGPEITGGVVTVLRNLVAKSLVEARHGGSARYRLLETVRMFGQQKSVESGMAERLRLRHRDWLLEWVNSVPFGVHSMSRNWSRSYIEDFDNVLAAVDWSIDRGEWDNAALLVAAGSVTWRGGFRCIWAVETCEQLLTRDLEPTIRCRLLVAGADASMAAARNDLMTAWTATALAEGRALGDPTLHALAAVWSAIPLLLPDHQRGLDLIVEAHAVADTPLVASWVEQWATYARHADRLGDPLHFDGIADWADDSYAFFAAHLLMATNDAVAGHLDAARQHIETVVRVWIDNGEASNEAVLVEAIAGEPDQALHLAAEARRELERTSETLWRAQLVLAIAIAKLRLGDTTVALGYLEHLKTEPMYHPKFYDLRRRYSRQAREAIRDPERIASIRANAAELDTDEILDHELGPARSPRS